MPAAPIPHNESERQQEIDSLDLLSTIGDQAYRDIVELASALDER
jgi:hypothetical protein